MTEYKVTVYTKVRETYFVEADSLSGARLTWHDGVMDSSECEEILDVDVEVACDSADDE